MFRQYFVTVVGHRMGTLVEADMRRDVFSHMQELSYSFFDRNLQRRNRTNHCDDNNSDPGRRNSWG